MRGGPRRVSGTARALEESAPPAVAPPAAAPTPAQRGAAAAGGAFKSAAVEVLRRTHRFMTTGEICRSALDWGLLTCSGKTPEATMASAMYGDLKRRDRHSLFIRPHEGLFGLREWAVEGRLPAWQADAPAGGVIPAHSGSGDAFAAAGAVSLAPGYGSCGVGYASAGLLPVAAAAAVATGGAAAAAGSSPSKRAAPSGGPFAAEGGKGPGRPKKARGGSSQGDDWSGESDSAASDSESEGGGSAQPERLEPKLYSLRKGQVGRLQQAAEAAAAAAPGAGAAAATAAAAAAAGAGAGGEAPAQQEPGAGHVQAALPDDAGLEPLQLPDFWPRSADGTQPQQPASRHGSAGRCTVTAGLLSPPLYAALLQSPLLPPAHSAVGRGGAPCAIFSPGHGLPFCRSPLLASPLLASFGKTPAGLPGLLSPFLPPPAAPDAASQHAYGSGQQLCAGGGAAAQQRAAVPALVRGASGAHAGEGVPPAMVPIFGGGAPAGGAAPGQPLGRLPGIPPLHLYQPALQTPVGESAGGPAGGGADGAGACIPEVVFRLAPQPEHAAAGLGPSDAAAAGPTTSSSSRGEGHGGGRGADGAAAASCSIAAKIREIEDKVRRVEDEGGLLSLKTARAHFLLHYACRHPQAPAAYARKAAAALQRARDVLMACSVVGPPDPKAADGFAAEFAVLERDIQAAAAAAAGGAPGAPHDHL